MSWSRNGFQVRADEQISEIFHDEIWEFRGWFEHVQRILVHDKRCACGKIALVGIRINLKALLGGLSTIITGEYIASVHG